MKHILEKHYVNRVGWLRAGVLGANDGLLSITSIVIGVAAADPIFSIDSLECFKFHAYVASISANEL